MNSSLPPLVFVGSNSNILQMADICRLQNIPIAGIIDNDYWNDTESVSFKGIPVIGSEHNWHWSKDYCYFVATHWVPDRTDVQKRNYHKKLHLIKKIQENSIECINLIHPSSTIAPTCKLGKGVLVDANVSMENYCILDDYSRIYSLAALHHNAHIGFNSVVLNYAFIGGGAHVDDHSYVGIRASLINSAPEPLVIPKHHLVKPHALYTHHKRDHVMLAYHLEDCEI
jgi:NDP-sugar pyrophosphorylase family protein